jgi:hydroxymethylglutaryl-CoA lyase
MSLPEKVTVVEVGPRDGFQNEPGWISTENKIAIINRLSETGLTRIEATSFVHPKAVPQLADANEVIAGITRRPGVTYMALIPNLKGCQRAIDAGIDEVEPVVSASESHNKSNMNMSIAESLSAFRDVVELAKANNVPVRGGVATAFGCPFEGRVSPKSVERIVDAYLHMGVHEICLSDTIGTADPSLVMELVRMVTPKLNGADLGLHFHNTRGSGLANVLAGMLEGVSVFDASICGLGGCPFAPGATGNIATADLVNMLQSMGIETGVDLQALIDCERMVRDILGRELAGQVMKAGPTPWAIRQ